jgi:hypothetical protein
VSHTAAIRGLFGGPRDREPQHPIEKAYALPVRSADEHYNGGGGGGHGLRGVTSRFALIVMMAAIPVSRAPTAVTSAERAPTITEKLFVSPEGGGGGAVVVTGGAVVVEGGTSELEVRGMVDVVGGATVGTVVGVPLVSDSAWRMTQNSVNPPKTTRASPTARILPGLARDGMPYLGRDPAALRPERETPPGGWGLGVFCCAD